MTCTTCPDCRNLSCDCWCDGKRPDLGDHDCSCLAVPAPARADVNYTRFRVIYRPGGLVLSENRRQLIEFSEPVEWSKARAMLIERGLFPDDHSVPTEWFLSVATGHTRGTPQATVVVD